MADDLPPGFEDWTAEALADGEPAGPDCDNPPSPETANRNGADAHVATFGTFRPVRELINLQPPNFVIESLLQQATRALVWGKPGSLKTTHVVDWWARVGLGEPWRGLAVRQGAAFFIPLEDLAGFQARVEAWEEHHGNTVPDCCQWWDGPFDFSQACMDAVAGKMKALADQTGQPVRFLSIDPLLKGFGEASALDERDFRKRLAMVDQLMQPFDQAVAILITHSAWDDKHELGSVIQRALTATSIHATADGDFARLKVVRQKNAAEGDEFAFRKVPFDAHGKIALNPIEKPPERDRGLNKNQASMFAILKNAGAEGLTVKEWNNAAREGGLGVKRRADLMDYRNILENQKLVCKRKTDGKWFAVE